MSLFLLFLTASLVEYSLSFKYPKLFSYGTCSKLRLNEHPPSRCEFIHIQEYPNDNYDHIHGIHNPNHSATKLQQISADRIKEVIRNKSPKDVSGCGYDSSFFVSPEDLLNEIEEFDDKYGKPLDLFQKLIATQPKMALAAEFKRSSPSKGDLNVNVDIIEQCKQYASMGASVISVLTESKYFKGTLDDMKKVRLALQEQYGDARPAILRKDFIFDRYQLLEARAYGADTALLIVAALGQQQLYDLITYSRTLGMEPLVEVNTEQEMRIALQQGAKVVGINNRNLHDFQLDLRTTSRLVQILRASGRTTDEVAVAALSGISSAAEVRQFQADGVKCCLVGESLMKASDPARKIAELFSSSAISSAHKIVKVCGMTDLQQTTVAIQQGVNLVGLIFAAQSRRRVTLPQARQLTEAVQSYGERSGPANHWLQQVQQVQAQYEASLLGGNPVLWYREMAQLLISATQRTPLTVGVFQDQSAVEINEAVQVAGLDLVQLHGNESPELVAQISVPCIKVVSIPVGAGVDRNAVQTQLLDTIRRFEGRAVALLLDSRAGQSAGGTGQAFDWTVLQSLPDHVPVLLAGGLTVPKVEEFLCTSTSDRVFGLDVNSGVETAPGRKNLPLIEQLVHTVRQHNSL